MIVGKSPSPLKTFDLHTHVFRNQSSLLAAKSVAADPPKPMLLENEDPELFQTYINCVYFGMDILEQWKELSGHTAPLAETDDQKQEAADGLFEKHIMLYLLAKRVNDLKTANAVIDEIIRFSDSMHMIPAQPPISQAYTGTHKFEPLRKLLQDIWIYDAAVADIQRLRTSSFPYDFVHGVAVGLLEVDRTPTEERDYLWSASSNCDQDVCYYHLHDEKHPRCATDDSDEDQER